MVESQLTGKAQMYLEEVGNLTESLQSLVVGEPLELRGESSVLGQKVEDPKLTRNWADDDTPSWCSVYSPVNREGYRECSGSVC